MDKMEELLKKERQNYDDLKAPKDMEIRLQKALNKKKETKWRNIALVASLFFIFFFTYNYNAFAYYGKRLLGYDTVMSQSLQDLNELGEGQSLDKTYTFDNGLKLTVEGVMVDDSQLLLFYRLNNPKGVVDENFLTFPTIKGFFKEYRTSWGQGEMNDTKTEMKWIHSFEAPDFYEKTLKFQGAYTTDDINEEFSISFKLDRSKAMGHSIKQRINKSITLGNQEVYFKNILATPTQTIIKGSLASTFDLVKEQLTGELIRPDISFDLLVNHKTMKSTGSGMSSNHKGILFESTFDPLPKNLKSLQIKIKELTVLEKVDKEFPLTIGENKILNIKDKEVIIHQVESKKDKIEVTIESEESILLENLKLSLDGKTTFLEGMHSEEYTKEKNGQINKKRTLVFDGQGKDLKFKIDKIQYKKKYDKIIEIPVK